MPHIRTFVESAARNEAPFSSQPYPNAAVFLSLQGVGFQDSRRVRMVCTDGPSQVLADPKEITKCP